MQLIDRQSVPAEYIRENGFVEFDGEKYFACLVSLLSEIMIKNQIPADEVGQITLTGQAESLVILEMNEVLAQRELPNSLIFLPYLVGTNAPEFDADASSMFYGLRQEHDIYDMACAVMEGVAFMLRKNCDHICTKGTEISHIIATGGGAKSPIWCQLQADITGLPVVIPTEKEAACLGATLVGAVTDGVFRCYEEATQSCVTFQKRYQPTSTDKYEAKYKKLCALYEAMLRVARM